MKKTRLLLSGVAITTLTLFTSWNGDISNFHETATYKEVKIGKQIWMAENLNLAKFRNGDPIPQAKTNEEWNLARENMQPAWCYYDNDTANEAKYGKLYNWYAVNDPRGLAPVGWHIPTLDEWRVLTNNLGFDPSVEMKSDNGWYNDGNGTNSSGFSALPGGHRDDGGPFYQVEKFGYWWSSTEARSTSAWYHHMYYQDWGDAEKFPFGKGCGMSIRCLKN